MMGISIWQLLIILAIVLVLFGAKRLRNLGGDLGTAVRGFREAVRDEDKDKEEGEGEGETEDGSGKLGGHLGADEGRDEDFAESGTRRPEEETHNR